MATMGLGGGLEGEACFKRKFRWLLFVENPSPLSGQSDAVTILPPQKGARPNISFKEMQVEHLTETLWYPSKPDYKPIQITLYDIKTPQFHPIFEWVRSCFDAQEGQWRLPAQANFLKNVRLELYDGCGTVIEQWRYENAWPQQVDFGDLDMGSSEVITCDITLRYARAYIVF